MKPLAIGVSRHSCVRPLIHGLRAESNPTVRLSYDEPSALADAFRRGFYDAAFIPSIEYLRGAGKHLVSGPALVGRSGIGSPILLTKGPLDETARIAVGEFCRTPIAALRIILGEAHQTYPDLCVEKNIGPAWADVYDGVLLSGDTALRWHCEGVDLSAGHNISAMWTELTGEPLVHGVWVYNDPDLKDWISDTVTSSRNTGIAQLSTLADTIAAEEHLPASDVYDYLNTAWGYDLGTGGAQALRVLETLALKYDVMRTSRLEKVAS